MTTPNCFAKFDKESVFCNKICKHADECNGGKVERSELEELKYLYGRKMLSFKEYTKYYWDALKRRQENAKDNLIK